MKIRALELQHFRKFTQPMRLTGLRDGVNVLAECNEFGKSTVLAAIRGVLFERYTSKARGVEGMRNWANNTSPQVMLEFEREGGIYRIEKRFLHREPFARLRMPDGSLHEGDAAEEKLQQILGFRKPGNKGSQPEDHGMWGALWVTQLHATRLPELPDYARQTVHGCLENEVSSLTGGLRGQKFLEIVDRDLAALLNGRNQPTGAYKQVLEGLEKTAAKAASIEQTRDQLRQNIEALAKATQRLAELDAAMQTDVAEQAIAEARLKKEAAQRFDDSERLAEKDVKLTEGRIAELQQRARTRAALKASRDDAERRLRVAAGEEASANELLQRSDAAVIALQGRLNELSEALDAAAQSLRRSRTISSTTAAFADLGRLETRLAAADAARQRVNTLTAQLSAIVVTEASVEAASALATTLERLQTTLNAQATQVIFELQPESLSRVSVDGAAPPDTLAIVRDTTIEIAGIGKVQIRPAIKDRTTLLAQIGETERQLRSALSAMNAQTVAQARQELVARVALERELDRARNEERSHTLADTAAGIAAGMEPLRNQIAMVRERAREALDLLGLDALPAVEAAREDVSAAEAAETAAVEALAVARAPLAGLQSRYKEALKLHAACVAELSSARNQSERLNADFEREQATDPQEDLQEQQAAALNRLTGQQQQLQALQATRPIDTVALMDSRIARYEKMNAAQRDERSKTVERIAVLRSQIDQAGGLGVDEELEALSRTSEALTAERARFEREIQVLQLLSEELRAAEQAAKERYMAPLVQRITPYLQTLFPGAAIHVDEEFQVTGVMRDLAQMEDFNGLSSGTQEQIAVLTRLAFADMLLDTGKPAMLILDDALAYSDADRLERMFDLLTQASSRLQILVLTCRGEVFTRLGGHRLELVPISQERI